MIRTYKVAVGLALAAVVLASGTMPIAAQAQPTPAPARDWDVPGGRYFTQAGGGSGGFTLADDDGQPFWSAFQHLGGLTSLGYPASRRFTQAGFVYQLTQAALLQYRPEQGGVVLGNTFELLQEAGRDAWLRDYKGIPAPIVNDGSTSFEDAVRIRLGWLTEPAIRERYFQNPNPAQSHPWSQRDAIDLYGLPMSRPERIGPYIAQRFQRVAFQLWVQDVPGLPASGSVTAVLGGDLLKEAGLVGGQAATPHGAGAVVSRPVSLAAVPAQPAPTAPPTATPSPRLPDPAVSAPTPRAASPDNVLETSLSEYSIYLARLTVKPGTVRFSLTNVGVQRHNLRVVGNGVDRKSMDLVGGRSGQLDVTFVETGPYYVYCDIADHEQLGMALTLNVGD